MQEEVLGVSKLVGIVVDRMLPHMELQELKGMDLEDEIMDEMMLGMDTELMKLMMIQTTIEMEKMKMKISLVVVMIRVI